MLTLYAIHKGDPKLRTRVPKASHVDELVAECLPAY